MQILHQKGLFYLDQITDPASTNLWHQGWMGSQELEIPDLWSEYWNRYITALHSSHIRLTNSEDKFVWEHAKHGQYTPRTCYQQICSQHFQLDQKWWQAGI